MSVLTTRKRKPVPTWRQHRSVGVGFLLGVIFVSAVAFLLLH